MYGIFIYAAAAAKLLQLCPTLCDPMDCSLPGFSIHGIFQARTLEWVTISFSRRSSQPRDCTRVSLIVGRHFTVWATREILTHQGSLSHHGTTDWFQIGKGVHQGCILSPCLFNLYAEYIIRNAGLDEAQAEIKTAGRNINNLRYADDTTLMAESEEELKGLLMKVKERGQ